MRLIRQLALPTDFVPPFATPRTNKVAFSDSGDPAVVGSESKM
jgi:hypothetical protein